MTKDRCLIVAVSLVVIGAFLTIATSSFGLMGHYDAKVFVIIGGLLALVVIFVSDPRRRNGS